MYLVAGVCNGLVVGNERQLNNLSLTICKSSFYVAINFMLQLYKAGDMTSRSSYYCFVLCVLLLGGILVVRLLYGGVTFDTSCVQFCLCQYLKVL